MSRSTSCRFKTTSSRTASRTEYFEAAIVGTLTIATPTFAYRGAIDDGRNGYLASAQQWADVLREQEAQ